MKSAPISEAQLQAAVVELAGLLGWRVHHGRPAVDRSGRWSTPITGDVGFPDLVLVRGGKVLFAELKSEKGKVSSEQEAWLEELRCVPCDCVAVHIWRPADWTSGRIEQALRGPTDMTLTGSVLSASAPPNRVDSLSRHPGACPSPAVGSRGRALLLREAPHVA